MASIASLLLLLVMGSILLAAIPSMAAARGMKLGTRQNSKGSDEEEGFIAMPTEKASSQFGTRWAILLAGSSGYGNYRHQADVCHAYQVLKRGGLNDENIVVFMADDIAQHPANPHPGIIINNPLGSDVYAGVPKDYTGQNVTVDNFYAALLGNKSALTGGSGKVVDSGPDDHIFIFYSDHGGPGVLGMPTNPNLYANDFIEVLKQKYAANAYKEMVIYVEACESGSIFEGLLPDNINIYVTTASNAIESSWGTYCPGMHPAPPPEYYTCLGDLYSVSWMEDSEMHNLERETIRDQYNTVKTRTSNGNTYTSGSHVMQYGELKISIEALETYMGSDPVNQNLTRQLNGFFPLYGWDKIMAVNQRDADLLYLWFKYKMADEGTKEKSEALEEMIEVMSHRSHLDRSVKRIGHLLFSEQGSLLSQARPHGQPLADDWDCLKSMVRVFESQCGSLGQYGLKHMRVFANICNAKVSLDKMVEASSEACSKGDLVGPWNPHQVGFSA